MNSGLAGGEWTATSAESPERPVSPARRVLRGWWPWLAAALSGVLLVLCFAPWNFTPLVWIALVPLICAVWFSPSTTRPARRCAQLGYVAGLIYYGGAFYWLYTLGVLFHQPFLYGIPLLLALYMGLYLGFWTWFIGRVLAADEACRRFPNSSSNLLTGALGAAAWVSHEWVRGWFLSGFGWNNLGVALHNDLPIIQIAAITGVLGLSGLVVFVNLMSVIVVRRIVGEFGANFLKRVRWEFSLSVAVVVAVFAYGINTLLHKSPSPISLNVVAVQPNIPQEVKFSGTGEDHIFEQLGGLTELAAMSKPDLLIWPESATPRGMYSDNVNYAFVKENAARGDYGFLLGTVEEDLVGNASYNSAKLLTERGAREQTHRKMHLVPFGEYLPLRLILAPALGMLVPGDFTAGNQPAVFDLPKPAIKFSALICFEDTLGDLTRRFVLNGAQLLVNITNDGWFLKSAGSEQHLHEAIFRAVENRRPLVRCTNTGITCSVDRHGHVDAWLPRFEKGFASRHINVPKYPEMSWYTRNGDRFAHGCAALTAATLLLAWWRRRAVAQ